MFEQREIVQEIDGLKKFAHKLSSSQDEAEDLLQSTLTRALEKKHGADT